MLTTAPITNPAMLEAAARSMAWPDSVFARIATTDAILVGPQPLYGAFCHTENHGIPSIIPYCIEACNVRPGITLGHAMKPRLGVVYIPRFCASAKCIIERTCAWAMWVYLREFIDLLASSADQRAVTVLVDM